MEDMEFILKNCIDISGEMDMTKPPEFIWEEKFRDIKKISNINQKKVNNIVRISICPIQMFKLINLLKENWKYILNIILF